MKNFTIDIKKFNAKVLTLLVVKLLLRKHNIIRKLEKMYVVREIPYIIHFVLVYEVLKFKY